MITISQTNFTLLIVAVVVVTAVITYAATAATIK